MGRVRVRARVKGAIEVGQRGARVRCRDTRGWDVRWRWMLGGSLFGSTCNWRLCG